MNSVPVITTPGDNTISERSAPTVVLADLDSVGVYRLLDENGSPIYIGQTENLMRRLGQHAAHQPWWTLVCSLEWIPCDSRFEAEMLERDSIERENPEKNRMSRNPLIVKKPLPRKYRELLYDLSEKRDDDRLDSLMRGLHDKGWTLAAIGEPVGITRERVRQRISTAIATDDIEITEYVSIQARGRTKKIWPTITDAEADELRELQASATKCRGIHPKGHPYRTASERLSERLAEYKIRGVREKDLAKVLGVQTQTVRVRLKNHGYLKTSPSQKKYGTVIHPRISSPKPRTECMHGHPLTGENVRFVNGDTSRPVCQTCARAAERAYQDRKKAAA